MTDDIDYMSPESSPKEISKTTGVRRVNNLPIYIAGGVISVFLIVVVLVAMDRAKQQKIAVADPVVKEKSRGNTQLFAKEIAGDHKDGIIAATPPTVPDLPGAVTQTPSTSASLVLPPQNVLPLPPNGALVPPQTAYDDQLLHIRQIKMQQFEEALKAKSTVQVVPLRNGPHSDMASIESSREEPSKRDEMLARLSAIRRQLNSSNSNTDTGYQARLASLSAGKSADSAQLMQTSTNQNGRNGIGQFAGDGASDRWKLDAQPDAPRSPYELRAGFVIPAILISGINSDLPGQIFAQVSQDVYDTPTGKYKLIPQGSRLIGAYSNEVVYGQSRVLIAWQRIIFPDGKALDIGAMPGADSAGYAGFNDKVNNHYIRLFASAFLMSGVTAGITLSQGNKNQNPFASQTASGALSEALGQQLGQVTAQMINKNLNISPTLEVRPGFRFNVVVVKDMTFSKPYQAFDYNAKEKN